MILVLGATGTTGGEVARQLIAAGHKPRVLVRSRAKASTFEGKAEILEGDLDQADSLVAALAGVKKVYLVSAGLDGPKLEASVIRQAAKAKVEHIVKLSVVTADDPHLTFAKWHAQSEKHLVESGVPWTMLRPGNFMTNALGWADTIKAQGAFYQPTGTGKWAAIDPADIGAVAVKALTSPGFAGKAFTLTGPESLDGAGYAAILSKVTGKKIAFVDVPPDAARDGMLKAGLPALYVDALIDLLAVMKAGYTDMVTDGVEQALGRKPGSFEDWARRHVAAFT
jgi:uncharacterized protein YbjT (DUF2867 family)